jgi:hypothetical protein
MAVGLQNLTLSALNSHSALSLLVGALFKKFCLFFEHALYTECMKAVKNKKSGNQCIFLLC